MNTPQSMASMRSRQLRGNAWVSILPGSLAMLLWLVGAAAALPAGEQVAHGTVTFDRTGQEFVVNQETGRAIVNYNSFNVGSPEVVRFIQPDSSAAILNRVTGGSASTIAGLLQANGKVFLINPNGILFAPTARVDVHGLMASGLNMTDEDFLSDTLRFSGGGGSVANQGQLNGEFVHLVGGRVENAGTISAKAMVLAAGSSVLIGEAAGGEIRLVIDGKVMRATGEPQSDEHTELTSDLPVTEPGETAAEPLPPELEDLADRLVLGDIINEGMIDATGDSGGTVIVGGNRVAQMGTIVADGIEGDGGTVKLLANEYLDVSEDSVTTANAGNAGTGGNMYLYSDDTTWIREGAVLEARGGRDSGDGGFVEVSGKRLLSLDSFVDLTAERGESGHLLIDPTDVSIVSVTTTNGSFSAPPSPFTWNPDDVDTATLSASDLVDQLKLGSVTVLTTSSGNGNGNITVNTGIDYDGTDNTSLTLDAEGILTVDAGVGIDSSGGAAMDVSLLANEGIEIGSPSEGAAPIKSNGGDILVENRVSGNITVHVGSIIDAGSGAGAAADPGGNVDIKNSNGNISIGTDHSTGRPITEVKTSGNGIVAIDAPQGNVEIGTISDDETTVAITATGSGGIQISAGSSSPYVAGDISILSSSIESGSGDILISASQDTELYSEALATVKSVSGDITVEGDNDVTVDDNILATNGNIVVTAGRSVVIGSLREARIASGGGTVSIGSRGDSLLGTGDVTLYSESTVDASSGAGGAGDPGGDIFITNQDGDVNIGNIGTLGVAVINTSGDGDIAIEAPQGNVSLGLSEPQAAISATGSGGISVSAGSSAAGVPGNITMRFSSLTSGGGPIDLSAEGSVAGSSGTYEDRGTITVESSTIEAQGGAIGLMATGSGSLEDVSAGPSVGNVTVDNSDLLSHGGAIALSANGVGSGPISGPPVNYLDVGVVSVRSTTLESGGGDIALAANGRVTGDASASSVGSVLVWQNSTISSSGGDGTITMAAVGDYAAPPQDTLVGDVFVETSHTESDSGDVQISASHDIEVYSESQFTISSVSGDITMEAGNDVTVSDNILSTNGNIVIKAGNDVRMHYENNAGRIETGGDGSISLWADSDGSGAGDLYASTHSTPYSVTAESGNIYLSGASVNTSTGTFTTGGSISLVATEGDLIMAGGGFSGETILGEAYNGNIVVDTTVTANDLAGFEAGGDIEGPGPVTGARVVLLAGGAAGISSAPVTVNVTDVLQVRSGSGVTNLVITGSHAQETVYGPDLTPGLATAAAGQPVASINVIEPEPDPDPNPTDPEPPDEEDHELEMQRWFQRILATIVTDTPGAKERATQFNDFFFLHRSMQVSEFMMELDLNFIAYILFGEANITADARFPAQAKRTIYIGGEKPYYVAPVF